MANAESVQTESSPAVAQSVAAKKGNSPMMLLLCVAMLILLGLCGYLFTSMRALQAKVTSSEPAAEAAVKAPELYLQLDPAFVVNFQDADSTRYLQVGVTLMAHDPLAIQAIKDNDPVIRNGLVMLFSSQTYAQLSDTAGKQKLQAEALAAVRKIIADKLGKPGVDAVYFTSFVMQ
ncbi:MAG: flagellar basal body-associated FliL family protein [Rhodanobacter sp.]